MWHSFTSFWYFGPRTSWAVQMALFAPQLISLTCSGSVLYFTDGCLCGKVMFCQRIYKCPLFLHTYWKLIGVVNNCAHFSPVFLFTQYKARLYPLALLFHRFVEYSQRGIFFPPKERKLKTTKDWWGAGVGIKCFCTAWSQNHKVDDDLHLCLCSPEYLQDSSMYMGRQGGKTYREKTASKKTKKYLW